MALPTEPIGSIPRPVELMNGMRAFGEGRIGKDALQALLDGAVRDTIRRFDETGSPVITDGEQRKPSFATYPVHGLPNLAPGGVTIPFKDGHARQLPVLTSGPFRYATYAAEYLEGAKKYASWGSRSRPYISSSRTFVSASFQAVSNCARVQAASAVFFWASSDSARP